MEFYVANNMKQILSENYQERELLKAILCDESCIALKDCILSGWRVEASELSPELSRLFLVRDSLTLYGDIIMYE